MNFDKPSHNPNAAPRNPQAAHSHDQMPQNQFPQKKSNTWLWVLGTIGVLTIVGGLVCCGGSYFMFQIGQTWMADGIKTQLADDPMVQEHIGEINSVSMNFSQTGVAAGEQPGAIAFDIEGDKGSGVVFIQQDDSGGGESFVLRSADLILPNGERHQLIPADNADSEIDASIIDEEELEAVDSEN